jgi:hypothetical protein
MPQLREMDIEVGRPISLGDTKRGADEGEGRARVRQLKRFSFQT